MTPEIPKEMGDDHLTDLLEEECESDLVQELEKVEATYEEQIAGIDAQIVTLKSKMANAAYNQFKPLKSDMNKLVTARDKLVLLLEDEEQ